MTRIAASAPTPNINDEDKSTLDRVRDKLRNLYARPASGRTTALGRKVEKPGTGKQGGPSGQRDLGQVDGKHANK
jgi:hypothetical protein